MANIRGWECEAANGLRWTLDGGHLVDADGNVLAHFPYNLGDEADRANARLAAAAPELLQELRRLVDRCERLPSLMPGQAGMLETLTREAALLLGRLEAKEEARNNHEEV